MTQSERVSSGEWGCAALADAEREREGKGQTRILPMAGAERANRTRAEVVVMSQYSDRTWYCRNTAAPNKSQESRVSGQVADSVSACRSTAGFCYLVLVGPALLTRSDHASFDTVVCELMPLDAGGRGVEVEVEVRWAGLSLAAVDVNCGIPIVSIKVNLLEQFTQINNEVLCHPQGKQHKAIGVSPCHTYTRQTTSATNSHFCRVDHLLGGS